MNTSGKSVLYGRYIAKVVCDKIKSDVSTLNTKFNISPKLVVVEIGERSDSLLFMEQKRRFASSCDIQLHHEKFARTVSETTVIDYISSLNRDPSVHGIALQLPIDSTRQLDTMALLNSIISEKDVEGLNAHNTAALSREQIICPHCDNLKQFVHIPCTAAACYAFIRYTNFQLIGSHCVIVGRGRLVGAPTGELLAGVGRATVTYCDMYTTDLGDQVGRADVLVAAVGHPGLVKGNWIKPGALVLDCGYTVTQDVKNPSKQLSVGDVEYSIASRRAKWITPVPGGVGPVSVAMLFRNTTNSAKWSVGLTDSVHCNCHITSNQFTVSNNADNENTQ